MLLNDVFCLIQSYKYMKMLINDYISLRIIYLSAIVYEELSQKTINFVLLKIGCKLFWLILAFTEEGKYVTIDVRDKNSCVFCNQHFLACWWLQIKPPRRSKNLSQILKPVVHWPLSKTMLHRIGISQYLFMMDDKYSMCNAQRYLIHVLTCIHAWTIQVICIKYLW